MLKLSFLDCGARNKKAKQKRTTRVHIDQHKTSTKSRTPITDTLIGKPKKDPAKNDSTKCIREKQTFLIETCQDQPTGECSHRKETKAKEIKTHSPD